MANICDSILSADILAGCTKPLVKGFEADGVIIPRAYIDFAASVVSTETPNIISSIVLNTGERGYVCQQLGSAPFTGTTQSLVVGTYINTWDSSVQLLVPSFGPRTAAEIIDALTNGEVVVILRNKTKDDAADSLAGSAEYQVFGWWNGCHASAGERDPYSDDTFGGVLLTLTETGSPKSAMFLWAGTAAATKTAYDALTEQL